MDIVPYFLENKNTSRDGHTFQGESRDRSTIQQLVEAIHKLLLISCTVRYTLQV